jgi:hypothetical protein
MSFEAFNSVVMPMLVELEASANARDADRVVAQTPGGLADYLHPRAQRQVTLGQPASTGGGAV